MDIHHESKVPNTRWAAENTQPCVHTCSLCQEDYSRSYTKNSNKYQKYQSKLHNADFGMDLSNHKLSQCLKTTGKA